MPLIDDIGAIPFSNQKALGVFPDNPPPGLTYCAFLIESIKNQLVATGWTLADSLPATAEVVYPAGYIGASPGSSGTVGCSANVLEIRTPQFIYDWCAYAPGEGTAPGPCAFFELGTTGFVSIQNLAAAVELPTDGNGNQLWDAVATVSDDVITLTITSHTPGPAMNFLPVQGDGRFGVSTGALLGGGYLLESTGESPYSLRITGSFGTGGSQALIFEIIAGPGAVRTIQYVLPTTTSQYYFASNPYSFAIWDGVTAANSLGVFAPDIPTSEGFPSSAYALAIAPPNDLSSEIMWDGFFIPAAVCLDSYPQVYGDDTSGPGVLCLRSNPGGLPLYTLDQRPLATAAYLFMAAALGQQSYAVGKLWDCLVVTDAFEVGGSYQVGGRNFVVIASQDGSGGKTRASLLFCIDDQGQMDGGL